MVSIGEKTASGDNKFNFHVKALKDFLFFVKSSDSICFLLNLSPIVSYFTWKVNLIKAFKWKILFNYLENLKRLKIKLLRSNLISNKMMLPPTTHFIVGIRLQRKISFFTAFTISKWLKKYYFSIFIIVPYTHKGHINW